MPQELPRHELAPVGMAIFASVRRADGTHPSALREMVLEVDKDVEVDFRGLPVCGSGGLEVRARRPPGYLRRICRKAIVGTGKAKVEIAFEDLQPIRVDSPVTIFNGGGNGRSGRLLVHFHVTVPVPATIVAAVAVRPWRKGWRAVVKVPRIVGGAGSLLAFRLNLRRIFFHRGKRRSFLSARCPDGRFKVSMPKAVFRNETSAPGVAAQTILRGGIAVPCKAKR